MDKLDLLKRVSNIDQLAGVRSLSFTDGKAKGSKLYEVYNAAGLRFTVLPDRCMDLLDVSYKGVNFSYYCKNGLVANTLTNALDDEYFYTFSGGMLATCGLSNAGPACDDDGTWRTMHGRLGFTPAEQPTARTLWKDGDYVTELSGRMRESRLFGYNLTMDRTITTSLNSKEIRIRDVVTNCQPQAEEFMILYHFNFGYPLLDDGARLYKGSGSVTPRNEFAGQDMRFNEIDKPGDDMQERVYFHKNAPDGEGYSYVGIINHAKKLGAYLKYNADNLPELVQWKSMVSHDYVLGIEPSNSFIKGRKGERENGTLKVIPPYGEVNFDVTLGILDGDEEINAFIEKTKGL